jgi:hypothetical protein
VNLLIPALSEPEQHITEDLLAAVAILRQHEEMDGECGVFISMRLLLMAL